MRTEIDCIPCMLRQALETTRRITNDSAILERVARETLRYVADADLSLSPPHVSSGVYAIIADVTGEADAYAAVKYDFNERLLAMHHQFRRRIESADDPLDTALRMAIAGNIIDFGIHGDHQEAGIEDTVDHALQASLDASILATLRNDLQRAERILFLGDNAGEIVFDKLFLEQFPVDKVTYAVRGGPIINDSTVADARQVGLDKMVRVIENGTRIPGTVLEACSETFVHEFHQADVIISKGQGNFETLTESTQNIYFLLKVKCPIVAQRLGRPLGSAILHHSHSG